MKRPKRGRSRAPRALPMPRGVVLYVRASDAVERALIDAAVEKDLAALVKGEAPVHDWGLSDEQAGAIAADFGARKHYADWMGLVLLATRTVERVEGFEADGDETVEPSFDLFAALFEEAAFEQVFKQSALLLMGWLDDEKNGSGAAPSGRSEAAPSSAETAAPETTPSSGSRAPEASPSPTTTEPNGAALTTSTPPEPNPAQPRGGSPEALALGSQASAALPASIGAL